ncbi:MAG: PilW family protein [Halanaerobiales bacterium]
MDIRKEDGITLIEIILAVTIATVLAGIMYFTYLTSARTTSINDQKINYQQNHRLLVTRISPYIRAADEVVIDSTGSNDILRLYYTSPKSDDGGASEYDAIEFGLMATDKMYYQKRNITGGASVWGSRQSFIDDVSTVEFLYHVTRNIITMEIKLTGPDDTYEFTDHFYPRIEDLEVTTTP